MNATESPSPPAPDEHGPRIRVGVSSCLLGERVRATGGHSRDTFLVRTVGPWVEWVPICPEVEMGMPTPRPTIRLVGDPSNPRLRASRGDDDHTEAMKAWGATRLDALSAESLDGYVFKRGSPSCGLFRVRVYRDNGIPMKDGRGLFAAQLTERFPLLPAEEDGRLNDPRLRENFLERLFAHHRLRRFLATDATPGGLVRFHTAHKLALLPHSTNGYRELGRLVADAGSRPWPELADAYARGFMETLSRISKPGRHANVLDHLMGFLKEHLDRDDKAELKGLIEDYRREWVPLIVPLTLLKHHLGRHPVPAWVHQQVYLHPYPKELMLRNHV